jgi:hypothetical protein
MLNNKFFNTKLYDVYIMTITFIINLLHDKPTVTKSLACVYEFYFAPKCLLILATLSPYKERRYLPYCSEA